MENTLNQTKISRRTPKLILALGCIVMPTVVCGVRAQARDAISVLPPDAADNEESAMAAGNGEAAGSGEATGTGGTQILQVEDKDVATLAGSLGGGGVDAVSVGASRAALSADATANAALRAWVRAGGVVFLHSDAAQLFGFVTVPARIGTDRMAGQLFGQARAALPLGAHPLLWGNAGGAPSNAGGGRSLGVRTVYFQMQAGDVLVRSHPAGVGLLRLVDVAAGNSGVPLFACAIAPFGRGWAVVTPDLIETHRGDGPALNRNLIRLVVSSRAPFDRKAATDAALVSLPAAVIERLSAALSANQAPDWTPLGRALTLATGPTPANSVENQADAGAANGVQSTLAPRAASLIVSRGEAMALALLVAAPERNGVAAEAAIDLLRARLEMQRGDSEKAAAWVDAAAQSAPNAAETSLWRGIIAAARADDLLLSSRDRAASFNEAATLWGRAAGATALLNTANKATTIGGVPRAMVRAWSAGAGRAANLMAVEPPFVTPVGTRANALVLRHYPNDPTLRFAIPIGNVAARSHTTFGWRADEEEVLIFPSLSYFQAYRNAIGARGNPSPNALQSAGDIVGNRILMVSQPTTAVALPGPNGQRRFVQLGGAVPSVLGRLHAQVLINTLAGGGTLPPAWLNLGLVSLGDGISIGRADGQGTPAELVLRNKVGGLLSAEQFEGVSPAVVNAGFAELQARRMVGFFYSRFGAGRVVETLQRLGANQSIDDALEATTGLTESEFFDAWHDAEFPR